MWSGPPEPENTMNNCPTILRLTGPLDEVALRRAIAEIGRRHEPLRSSIEFRDGTPGQRIAESVGEQISAVDLSNQQAHGEHKRALQLAAEEALRPFDLLHGPLFRAMLIQLGVEDHLLVFSFHHLVWDPWSMAVFFRDLEALYSAFRNGQRSPLPELSIAYGDHAAWQHEQGPLLSQQLAFWTKELDGAPTSVQLPADHPRPAVKSLLASFCPIKLGPPLTQALRLVARRERATLFTVLLAAFQVMIANYAECTDLLVGVPTAGRTMPELEQMVGLFVNYLPIRAQLAGSLTFADILRQVKNTCFRAYANQELPIEHILASLVPEPLPDRAPLVQVLFSLVGQHAPVETPKLSGVRMETLPVPGIPIGPPYGVIGGVGPAQTAEVLPFDLHLGLVENTSSVLGTLAYSTDLFEVGTAERIVMHLLELLAEIAADPGQQISTLPVFKLAVRQ